jgi:hypothetical protein
MSNAPAWVARAAWVLVAVIGGTAVEAAVDGRSEAVRWVAGLGGWVVWGTVMAALAIPAVRSLTMARLLAPLSLVIAAVVAAAGAPALELAQLAIPAVVACAAMFTAPFGRQFVQASSYGDEERLPLRLPVAAGTAAIITWALWAPAVIIGPLLLAARNPVVGGILTVIGVAGLVLLTPRWHRLSRRWLVLVPAGLVVHDPVVLADTLMVRMNQLVGLRLAPADTEAADLTGPASGFAIEVQASETVTTVFAFTPKEPNGRAIHMTGFLISPSRPGEALRTAAARGIPVA